MKSLSLLKYDEDLVEIARHYQTSWSTSVARIDEGTYLQSDAEGNIIVLQQNSQGVTADDRKRLMVTSEMNLGEMVNRARTVEVTMARDAPVNPKAFLATVSCLIHLTTVYTGSQC